MTCPKCNDAGEIHQAADRHRPAGWYRCDCGAEIDRKKARLRPSMRDIQIALDGPKYPNVRLQGYTDRELYSIERKIWRHLRRIGGYQPFGFDWPTLKICHPTLAFALRAVRDRRDKLALRIDDVAPMPVAARVRLPAEVGS